MKKKQKRKGICVICGEPGFITNDHIPPKCIFGNPLPKDVITVPACSKCNNGDSKFDDIFKVYLSIHCATSHQQAARVLKVNTIRTLNKNQKLKKHIMSNIHSVDIVTKGGIFLKTSPAIRWDSEAHSIVLERTVRGLYHHHFKKILGAKAKVKIHWYSGLNKEIYDLSKRFATGSIGKDNEFIYKYSIADTNQLHSAWIFQFFNSHWAGAITEPVNHNLK